MSFTFPEKENLRALLSELEKKVQQGQEKIDAEKRRAKQIGSLLDSQKNLLESIQKFEKLAAYRIENEFKSGTLKNANAYYQGLESLLPKDEEKEPSGTESGPKS